MAHSPEAGVGLAAGEIGGQGDLAVAPECEVFVPHFKAQGLHQDVPAGIGDFLGAYLVWSQDLEQVPQVRADGKLPDPEGPEYECREIQAVPEFVILAVPVDPVIAVEVESPAFFPERPDQVQHVVETARAGLDVGGPDQLGGIHGEFPGRHFQSPADP